MSKAPPLTGVRVLEIGNLVAAPSAARILADFGADVIKIEAPDGDPLRKWGSLSPSGSSWWWYAQNRNKRLISINLKSEGGKQVIKDLASQCDVLIENLRPGRLDSAGLGYRDLCVINPGLVYVSISGFGLTGPYRHRPGFGHVAESMGGIRYVTGFPDRPPVRTGMSIGDELAALQAVIGTLMALHQRNQDPENRGDHVDVALTESVLAITEGMVSEYLHTGLVQERTGNQLLRAAPSNIYSTKDDRWIAIGANSPGTFAGLLRVMGREDLQRDGRYQTNPGRVAHADELDDLISAWTKEHLAENLIELLNYAGVPAGPVMSAKDIALDSHYKERDMVVQAPSKEVGPVGMIGVVPKLENHPGEIRFAAGAIGQNTEEILRDVLHWSGQQIQAARDEGVVK